MQTMYPYLLYEDLAATPEFLEKAFGFRKVEPRAVRDGHHRHTHVEMELADGSRIRMSQAGDGFRTRPAEGEGTVVLPRSTGRGAVVIQIHVDDIDAHFDRAKAAGATIVRPLEESHGDRVYVADDPEGQRWHFVESAPGATDG
jgi:PhnB protein